MRTRNISCIQITKYKCFSLLCLCLYAGTQTGTSAGETSSFVCFSFISFFYNWCKGLLKNSRSSVIWSAVPSAPQGFQISAICYGAVVPKGPMTCGTTQGDSESPFLHFHIHPSLLMPASRASTWLSRPSG